MPSKIFNFFDSIRGEAPFYVFSLSQPFDGEGEMYKEYGKGITGLKDWIAKNME